MFSTILILLGTNKLGKNETYYKTYPVHWSTRREGRSCWMRGPPNSGSGGPSQSIIPVLVGRHSRRTSVPGPVPDSGGRGGQTRIIIPVVVGRNCRGTPIPVPDSSGRGGESRSTFAVVVGRHFRRTPVPNFGGRGGWSRSVVFMMRNGQFFRLQEKKTSIGT